MTRVLKSHPGKALKSHLMNTYLIGDRLLKSKQISFSMIDYEALLSINRVCLMMHDSGKAMQYFQDYMIDIEKGLDIGCYGEMKDHGLISGVLAYHIAYELFDDELYAFIVLFIVSHHHGNLSNVNDFCSKFRNPVVLDRLDKQYKNLNKKQLDDIYSELNLITDFSNTVWEDIKKSLNRLRNIQFIKRLKKIKSIEGYLIINMLFSLLVYSDKIEAIYHSVNDDIEDYINYKIINNHRIDNAIVDNYKRKMFGKELELPGLREQAYINVNDNINNMDLSKKILSINLPTGSGKTLTALNAAIALQNRVVEKKGYIPKIIYVLPFTSIIEQNYDVFCKVLGTDIEDTIIKHHYLSDRKYRKDTSGLYDYEIGEHFIESWDSQIIVSTFVQLFHSVFTNKNRQFKKFHNIANSIIILDEIQSIPFKYWSLVKNVFKLMAEFVGCYFILMTATMPLIFSEKDKEISELASKKDYFFESFNRIRLNCELLNNPMNLEEFKKILEKEIKDNSDKSILIVLNTIKSSINIWEHIYNEFKGDYKIFYLSSNIIPKHKHQRIEEIKKYKGKKIVISTQVVEAGVDIDLDIVYRDSGPFDSINQVAGRCNREGGKNTGIVKPINLIDENNKDKPYSSYVYDALLLDKTQKTLKGIVEIEEKDILNLSNKYFEQLYKYGDDGIGKELLDMINNLNYKDAFEYTENKEKNERVFSLISTRYKTIEVFIELDEEARKLWAKFQELSKIKDRFVRKKEFSKIKKEFLQYVVSVPVEAVKKHFNVDNEYILYVSMDMLETVYDIQTGFIRGEIGDYML